MKIKHFFALVLAVLMAFTGVIAVSAQETTAEGAGAGSSVQDFEFEKTDVRNFFENQVIYVDQIAPKQPVIDGKVEAAEYTTLRTVSNYRIPTQTADVYFAYLEEYLYVAIVKDAGKTTKPYTVQVDVGSASHNHPYVSVDRIQNQINAKGAVTYNGYLCYDDAGLGEIKHPRELSDPKQDTFFITEAVNCIVDGQIIVEMKLDVVEIMRFFAEYDAYREGWKVEMNSRAITFMFWMNRLTAQYCCPTNLIYGGSFNPNPAIDWSWVMYTVVLPESPGARYAIENPLGEMKWEKYDARNMFKGQVMTLSGIAETVPTVDGIIEKHEYVNSFPILIWNEKDRKSEVHISYKDGFLYMGVQMKSGAPINTQIDFGNASCNSPYVTVNRTTQQISLNGKLSTSGGQLMRCNDGKAWNLRGDHPSGDGALMLTQAATSWKDGVMTFEYVADVVKLIKWFADHEAYCESEVELASRAITWQCWAPESDTGVKGVQSQFTCPSSNAYFGVYFPGQTITWNWVMHTIVLPEQPAVHLSDSYIEPPIPEIPTLPNPEDGSDATEEITTAEPESTATVTETITAEAATEEKGAEQPKSGCKGSLISFTVILAVMASGVALTQNKKKKR